jgi:hypothetical protein
MKLQKSIACQKEIAGFIAFNSNDFSYFIPEKLHELHAHDVDPAEADILAAVQNHLIYQLEWKCLVLLHGSILIALL